MLRVLARVVLFSVGALYAGSANFPARDKKREIIVLLHTTNSGGQGERPPGPFAVAGVPVGARRDPLLLTPAYRALVRWALSCEL